MLRQTNPKNQRKTKNIKLKASGSVVALSCTAGRLLIFRVVKTPNRPSVDSHDVVRSISLRARTARPKKGKSATFKSVNTL